jgi:hypothetical protein
VSREVARARSAAAARVATIRALENSLVLPAADEYDRQLVLQAAQSFARRHGASTLTVGNLQVELLCGSLPLPSRCSRCRQPVKRIAYRLASDLLCSDCMRRRVGWGATRDDPAAGAGGKRVFP